MLGEKNKFPFIHFEPATCSFHLIALVWGEAVDYSLVTHKKSLKKEREPSFFGESRTASHWLWCECVCLCLCFSHYGLMSYENPAVQDSHFMREVGK